MLLLVSPLTRSDAGMNLSRDRRPIFHLSLEGFLDGQIRSMNRQRGGGMMIGSFQLVAAKPITIRLSKIQMVSIKIEVVLFVRGKSASDAFESVGFSFIQFEALAPDCPHTICLASLSWGF